MRNSRWDEKMYKTLRLLGVLVLAALPVGHASAASVTEDLVVSFSSPTNFSFSSLSFASPSSGNFLSGVSLGPYSLGSQTIFNADVTLDTTQTYTFAFNTGTFSGTASLAPSSSTPSFALINTSGGGSLFQATASVSPLATPLPASLPLFAMALLGLGVIGYRAARTNNRFASRAAVGAI
jgi:hypothetical protein